MYRKIVWCYIIVLALLDISLNTKLSAQGKSHGNGVSVHESLMEGISLQEWGKESGDEIGGRGRTAPAEALALSPPVLEFGRVALAAAHARTVTLTNTGNETIHLASVAGTTPDFHASFFESKTLVPQANTTFSVVYLGRYEGPVSTHLFIHTSRGLLQYPVSAEGVASAWRVWPLVGLRVPLNATLEPMLTLYNPTDTTIQVTEVYSSGSWLGLRLPGGGSAAPRQLWMLPPHSWRDLVRVRIRAPHVAATPTPTSHAPHRAYIRIKANMTGGGLVVGVEALGAAPGEYMYPLQLRLRTRGSLDSSDTFTLEAGNSDDAAVKLEAEVWGARCGAAPPDPPRPPHESPSARATANGGHADSGIHVSLLRETLEPHAPPAPAARLTLHYGAMWEGVETQAGAAEVGEAWCAGWARVGRAAAPFSLRLRPGTLTFTPQDLHFVTAAGEEALKRREVRAHNEFKVPVLIQHVHFPPEIQKHFHTESLAPVVLGAGRGATVVRLRLRTLHTAPLHARLTVLTNLTDYTLPLLVYEGRLHFEWDWAQSATDGSLELGVVSALSTRRVTALLHNRGKATLCVTSLHAELADGGGSGASLHMDAHARSREQPCVEPGRHYAAELTVAAGEEVGALAGTVTVHTAHAASGARVSLRVERGRVQARAVRLVGAAPHVHAAQPLALDNSVALAMRVTHLTRPPPALLYRLPEEESEREVVMGHNSIGQLVYAMEVECAPRCATGLDLSSGEGLAWLARARLPPGEALPADEAAAAARRASFRAGVSNLTAHVHTTLVRAVPVAVTVERAWPALLAERPPAPLAPLAAPAELRVLLRNPSVSPLALHAVVAGAGAGCACPPPACRPLAFLLRDWRTTSGGAAAWAAQPPLVLLQPLAEIELTVSFTPTEAADLAACLYLRNNLTILESVPLWGRGAVPSFELGGRAPNSSTAILLEVRECGAGGAGTVRRAVSVRNTGAVSVRLREWRVAGAGCAARGFRLQPCGALTLRPNETRALTLHYTPDWTRARAAAALTVRAGAATASFQLAAAVPARLVARCAPLTPRPPFEPALRALGAALAVLALLGAVALGALDAERALRRHRAAREAPPVRAPLLDLRALAAAPPDPPAMTPAPPPARRRRTPRRRLPAPDAAAERRAFERWREGVARRADDSRSSEEGETEARGAAAEGAGPAPAPAPPSSSSSPDSSPAARRSEAARAAFEAACSERAAHKHARQYATRRRAPHAASSGSESSGGSDRSEAEEGSPGAVPLEDTPPAEAAGDAAHSPPADPHPAEATSRRDSGGGGGRVTRGAGAESRVRTRSGSARSLGRKERLARRRVRGASPPAVRGAGGAAQEAGAGRAPPAVRWGASWSSVVSRGAAPDPPPGSAPPARAAAAPPATDSTPPPLAPIGSDVRRRAPSHSLFYYGAAEPELPWAERAPRPPAPVQPPSQARPEYSAAEEAGAGGAYRSLESVWGASMDPHPAAAAWLWGAPAAPPLRPPPGFAPRPYDPFHSLASIWTPAALDWRRRDRPDPSPPTASRLTNGLGPAEGPGAGPAPADRPHVLDE